jgi:hypothetical protein
MELTKSSIDQLMKKYPNGCPDHVIARKLGITEKEVAERYEEIIACLRRRMRV